MIALGVEEIEIRQYDPVVVPSDPDRRTREASAGQKKPRLLEPNRQIGAAFALLVPQIGE